MAWTYMHCTPPGGDTTASAEIQDTVLSPDRIRWQWCVPRLDEASIQKGECCSAAQSLLLSYSKPAGMVCRRKEREFEICPEVPCQLSADTVIRLRGHPDAKLSGRSSSFSMFALSHTGSGLACRTADKPGTRNGLQNREAGVGISPAYRGFLRRLQ